MCCHLSYAYYVGAHFRFINHSCYISVEKKQEQQQHRPRKSSLEMRSASQIWSVRLGGTLNSTSLSDRMLCFLRNTIFSSARRYSNGNRNRQLKLPSPVSDLTAVDRQQTYHQSIYSKAVLTSTIRLRFDCDSTAVQLPFE